MKWWISGGIKAVDSTEKEVYANKKIDAKPKGPAAVLPRTWRPVHFAAESLSPRHSYEIIAERCGFSPPECMSSIFKQKEKRHWQATGAHSAKKIM